MAKLTSEQRKNLPDDQFGLPSEKAFPMPDESHVRSAIAYFHTCPPKKRKELASNINRMAKKYNMKIKLKKYSAFRPYADRSIIEESAEYIETPNVVIENNVMAELNRLAEIGGTDFRTYHDGFQTQNVDQNYRVPTWNDKINSAINDAFKKAAQINLDKEYILNGRMNTTRISDYIYDSDLKLCYDITRNFFYTKSVHDKNMLRKIELVSDKTMLINAFNEIKNHTNAPVITKMCDEINFLIKEKEKNRNSLDTWWNMIDNKLKDNLLDPKDWLFLGIKKNYMNDMGYLARPSNFLNFSEEEIYQYQSNIKMIHKLCSKALFNLYTYFKFPRQKERLSTELIITEMSRRGIIDGYFINGDNTEISKNEEFRIAVKMNNVVWIPIHYVIDIENCMVTMVKMFDNDIHKGYFSHICDIFLRNRENKLPKIPIRRITFFRKNTTLEQSLEGITLDEYNNVDFDNTQYHEYIL